MIQMSSFQTYALGAFMLAAAHYVSEGDSEFTVAWLLFAMLCTVLHAVFREKRGDS
jgi:hypothetical protein